jgi:hypothetical protein
VAGSSPTALLPAIVGLGAGAGGCAFQPAMGHWLIDHGFPGGGTCRVIPDLAPSWNFEEADEGFILNRQGEVAELEGVDFTVCTLDRRSFTCDPLTFPWGYDGVSTLQETLLVSGEFEDRRSAAGDVDLTLECLDAECPIDGTCTAMYTFTAEYALWW